MTRPGGIIGRFGREFVLFYRIWNSIEVDLNDHRPPNKIFEVFGIDGICIYTLKIQNAQYVI